MTEAEKTSHTHDPWKYEFCQFAVFDDGRTPLMLTKDEYNRAKACVTACAGMRSPGTEIERLKSAFIEQEDQYADLEDRLVKTEQQRDELDALLAEFALLAYAIATDGAEPDHRRGYAKHLANKAESIAKHRGQHD